MDARKRWFGEAEHRREVAVEVDQQDRWLDRQSDRGDHHGGATAALGGPTQRQHDDLDAIDDHRRKPDPRPYRRPTRAPPHPRTVCFRCPIRRSEADSSGVGAATVLDGGVRAPGGLHRLQSGWDRRSLSGGFDSRPPPPTSRWSRSPSHAEIGTVVTIGHVVGSSRISAGGDQRDSPRSGRSGSNRAPIGRSPHNDRSAVCGEQSLGPPPTRQCRPETGRKPRNFTMRGLPGRNARTSPSGCRLDRVPFAVVVDADPTLSGRQVDDCLLAFGSLPAVAGSLRLFEMTNCSRRSIPLGLPRCEPALCSRCTRPRQSLTTRRQATARPFPPKGRAIGPVGCLPLRRTVVPVPVHRGWLPGRSLSQKHACAKMMQDLTQRGVSTFPGSAVRIHGAKIRLLDKRISRRVVTRHERVLTADKCRWIRRGGAQPGVMMTTPSMTVMTSPGPSGGTVSADRLRLYSDARSLALNQREWSRLCRPTKRRGPVWVEEPARPWWSGATAWWRVAVVVGARWRDRGGRRGRGGRDRGGRRGRGGRRQQGSRGRGRRGWGRGRRRRVRRRGRNVSRGQGSRTGCG